MMPYKFRRLINKVIKIILFVGIIALILTAGASASDALSSLSKSTDPSFSLFPTASSTLTTTYSPTLSPSSTFTANPIYTAIYLIVTPTDTPTITGTPTKTLIPTRTLRPSRTPLPTSTKRPSATPTPEPNYLPLFSHIFNKVRVYSGDPIKFVFTIFGASESCPIVPSGRGIFVRYPDGRFEWKDRNELLQSDLYFVRDDDPNIYSLTIDYIKCPGQ